MGTPPLGVRIFGEIAANPLDGLDRWVVYFSLYVRIFEFALGCMVSSLVRALPPATKNAQKFGARLTIGALIAIGVLFFVFSAPRLPFLITALRFNFGFAPFLATLIFSCARYQNGIVRALSSSRIVLAGEASYSIYLFHMVALDAFRYETAAITDSQIWIATILQAAVAWTATVGGTLVLWSLIEMPARRALRRWLTLPIEIVSAERAMATT